MLDAELHFIQSHYIEVTYGTENEIWAGFGPVGNTEKKIGVDYKQLLSAFFSCFQRQNFVFYSFLKYCSVRAKIFAYNEDEKAKNKFFNS